MRPRSMLSQAGMSSSTLVTTNTEALDEGRLTTAGSSPTLLRTSLADTERGCSPTVDKHVDFWAASQDDLDTIMAAHPLPPKRQDRLSVSSFELWSTYRMLFLLVFSTNMAVLVAFLVPTSSVSADLTSPNVATAAASNLLVAIMARNEHVVNLLFRSAVGVPFWAPLCIRSYSAKVYSYGGVHSGCAVAAVAWYIAYVGLVTRAAVLGRESEGVVALAYCILSLLVSISVFAHPAIRMRHHNLFELVHRFAGWTVVVLFWAQALLVAALQARRTASSFHKTIIKTPVFWLLIVITLLIAYSWLRLRRRSVRAEYLSSHAVRLHFDYGRRRVCEGVRLADRPLKETHSFAVIAKPDGQKGFSIIVSNAGDWTNRLIRNPPSEIWVRGSPTIGMLHVALAFRKVVLITTGSGIGPCLSIFGGRPDYRASIVWSAPDPLRTYGERIVADVLAADSGAVIVDTRRTGRPDLVRLAYSLYHESSAEAVLVMSNAKAVHGIVSELKARGVPALGPIFDSAVTGDL
ncbi:hypothetical protein LTR66_009260 [Elasticomyces elasticus]|nr:hypothetical protein LTR66_009260 [Elasticomyces elasticus]